MWVGEKPKVAKEGDYWYITLQHDGWIEETCRETWESAMEHALWMGLCAGVWAV